MTDIWLMESGSFGQFQAAAEHYVPPSPAELQAFEASYASNDFPGSRVMAKAGDHAEITIQGALTKNPSWFARYYGDGNTTYTEIIQAIAEAERDSSIKNIVLRFDSPGGNISGMTAAMNAIRDAKKPTTAIVMGMAASAAYGLASQANKIVAEDAGSMVGSIGIVQTMRVDPSIVDVTSSNAPDKRPDPTTEEGKAKIRATLDQIEALFISGISKGRGVSEDVVKSSYGQGAVFLADNALKNGMIDQIGAEAAAKTPKPKMRAKTMDLATLKADHPAIYAQVVALGVQQERDRVEAHLLLGAEGDMAAAISACKDGSDITPKISAMHQVAAIKKLQTNGRKSDESATANAADNPSTSTVAQEDEAKTIAAIDARMGQEAV